MALEVFTLMPTWCFVHVEQIISFLLVLVTQCQYFAAFVVDAIMVSSMSTFLTSLIPAASTRCLKYTEIVEITGATWVQWKSLVRHGYPEGASLYLPSFQKTWTCLCLASEIHGKCFCQQSREAPITRLLGDFVATFYYQVSINNAKLCKSHGKDTVQLQMQNCTAEA